MQSTQTVRTIEQLKGKIQYGDYVTLGALLNVAPATAKMRLIRGDSNAEEAIKKIIESREELIKNFKSK